MVPWRPWPGRVGLPGFHGSAEAWKSWKGWKGWKMLEGLGDFWVTLGDSRAHYGTENFP